MADVTNKNPKSPGKESTITSGGIETSVSNFMGSIMGTSPMTFTYGAHKTPGSQNAPIKLGGRGGSKASFGKNLHESGGK